MLDGDDLPEPLRGVLTGSDGLFAPLLRLLAQHALGGQFPLHRIEGLLDRLPPGLCPLDSQQRLIPCQPVMGQFRLQVSDRRLSLRQGSFRALPGFRLLPGGLACRFKLVGGSPIILAMTALEDGDRNLAIPDKAARGPL